MKLYSFFILLLFFSVNVTAQRSIYPKGGYRDLQELQKKSPSIPDVFTVGKRTQSDIRITGGNDYLPTSSSEYYTSNIIGNEVFAISTGDTLFLNAKLIKRQNWFVNVVVEGKYLVFKAGIHNGAKFQVGLVPGYLEYRRANKSVSHIRFWNILNSETGDVSVLQGKYVKDLLEKYPDLKNQFDNESETITPEILIKYVKLINERN